MNDKTPQAWAGDPAALMAEYEQRANTHDFDQVAPLIADEAVFWFNDGSYAGIAAIRAAFERTWALIQQERYRIDSVDWLVRSADAAVCTYHFHWEGLVNGQPVQGGGRGTSVLRHKAGRWQVLHEHLSAFPKR